jgi:hypothetical protein
LRILRDLKLAYNNEGMVGLLFDLLLLTPISSVTVTSTGKIYYNSTYKLINNTTIQRNRTYMRFAALIIINQIYIHFGTTTLNG